MMLESIRKADTSTLWALMADIAELLECRQYMQERSNGAFMFWYAVYKAIENELDTRLAADFMEG